MKGVFHVSLFALATVAVLGAVNPVSAASVIIRPDATSTPDQWTLTGGGTKHGAMSDQDIFNTFVISETTNSEKNRFELGNPSIPAGATVDSVRTTFHMCKTAGSPTGRCNLELSGNITNGTSRTGGTELEGECQTSWTEKLDRPGGGSWSIEELNDLRVEVEAVSVNGTNYNFCYEIWVEIFYTPLASETGTTRIKTTRGSTAR